MALDGCALCSAFAWSSSRPADKCMPLCTCLCPRHAGSLDANASGCRTGDIDHVPSLSNGGAKALMPCCHGRTFLLVIGQRSMASLRVVWVVRSGLGAVREESKGQGKSCRWYMKEGLGTLSYVACCCRDLPVHTSGSVWPTPWLMSVAWAEMLFSDVDSRDI